MVSELEVGENGGRGIYDIDGKGGVRWVGDHAQSFIMAFMTREGDLDNVQTQRAAEYYCKQQ